MDDAPREAARRAKHDLGKYVAFEARWLPEDAPDAEWVEALRADLLHTRRGPEGSEGAASIWARLRPSLPECAEVQAVDARVIEITENSSALLSGELRRPQLDALAAAARDIAAQLAALTRRLDREA
ncbi:MAG: hypothetical protein H6740_23410 [Alphaproteobacteria bacterium]|nr:hypothetical protein [Alphaproteobacteria bacterium]